MQTHSTSAARVPAIVVNNVPMPPLEIEGSRVVTLAMIDKVHARPPGTASRNFQQNRHRLVEGEDYRKLTADEIRCQSLEGAFPPRTRNGIVLTETGYLMLVKSFTDDLGWSVQRSLVKSYFAKPANDDPRPLHLAASREFRLTMNLHLKMAKMAGLCGNQALLSANAATAKLTGVDALKLLGVQALPAPQAEALLTPTDIGKLTEIGSPRKVNHILCFMGLQIIQRDAKGHIQYEPTEAGLAAGAVMLDTSKRHGEGTPIRQLKWASSVVGLIKARIERQTA